MPAPVEKTTSNDTATRLGSRAGYIPTLDGWRALAIIAVIFHHSALLRFGWFSTSWLFEFGNTGVSLFFGISGLLICTRLLEEEARTGSLHLRGFYVRRLLRIQPAALVYLLFILLLKLAGDAPVSWSSFVSALLLLRNYLPWRGPQVSDWLTLHYWSLSVEEHFYLLLPFFLYFIKRNRARFVFSCALVLMAWGAYAARHHLLGWTSYHRTDLCLPALLVPATVALLLQRPWFRQCAATYLIPVLAVPLALAIYISIWSQWRFGLRGLAYVAPSIAIVATMLHPASLSGRFLEWAPLRFLGRISYGLYLWQEILFTGHFAPGLQVLGKFSRFPLNFAAVLGLAVGSYYAIERPCMRLGHRLAHPALEGRPELRPRGLRSRG
jgi:peptidoglycan/LPS O-acetylase OafA/YrhL